MIARIALGIALISTVGLRQPGKRLDREPGPDVLGIALSSSVGLRLVELQQGERGAAGLELA